MINGPIPDEHLDPDFPEEYLDVLVASEDDTTNEAAILASDLSPEFKQVVLQHYREFERSETIYGRKAE